MSRHELAPSPDQPNVGLVAIGWDRPLRTFYVQVHARPEAISDPDADPVLLWRGTDLAELPTAGDALAIASRYARISDDLARQLEVDRLATLADADGVAQRLAKTWLFGSGGCGRR